MASKIFPSNIGPNCENALRCFFDLSPLEVKVYRELLENGSGTALEIGERIHRDRSTAYRSVSTLVSNGLAVKSLKNRDGGGIYHVYEAVDPEEVQVMLKDLIDSWYTEMLKVVERAPSSLRSD
jgi:predicted transcriptional regulator